MRMLTYNEQIQRADIEQISLVLGHNYIISFSEKETSLFNPLVERLRNPASSLRQRGADYLCYALIDCIVDHYFTILEKVDEKLATLEDELIINIQILEYCKLFKKPKERSFS
jgi:magnesium transporter